MLIVSILITMMASCIQNTTFSGLSEPQAQARRANTLLMGIAAVVSVVTVS